MKIFFSIILATIYSFGINAQTNSFCDKEQKEKIINLIKTTKLDDSLMLNPWLYDGLDDSSIIIVKTFSAKPIHYFKDFDYSKNILNYIDFLANDYFGVYIIKYDKKERYVYAVTSCKTGKCEEIVAPSPDTKFFLDPIFNSIKSHDNITLFYIYLINECFVKSGSDLFVLINDKLVEANAYMKANYPLDVLRRRYQ